MRAAGYIPPFFKVRVRVVLWIHLPPFFKVRVRVVLWIHLPHRFLPPFTAICLTFISFAADGVGHGHPTAAAHGGAGNQRIFNGNGNGHIAAAAAAAAGAAAGAAGAAAGAAGAAAAGECI
jgi:hypothetical protein